MRHPVHLTLAITLVLWPSARAQVSVRPGEPRAEPVSYCDLVQNPEKHDGQVVPTEAVWERTIHSSALADRSCLRVGGRVALTAPAFSKKLNHDRLGKKLGKIFAVRGIAVVDIIGVFHAQKGRDYGPENQRFQIEIQRLLDVRQIPNPPPE